MHRNAKFLEETNKSFRLARDLRLLHDLAPPIHNANAREFQRDVDSDIALHGCPPSPDAWGRLNVVTPFHHLSGDSHLHRSLGAGPITASSYTGSALQRRSAQYAVARLRTRSGNSDEWPLAGRVDLHPCAVRDRLRDVEVETGDHGEVGEGRALHHDRVDRGQD